MDSASVASALFWGIVARTPRRGFTSEGMFSSACKYYMQVLEEGPGEPGGKFAVSTPCGRNRGTTRTTGAASSTIWDASSRKVPGCGDQGPVSREPSPRRKTWKFPMASRWSMGLFDGTFVDCLDMKNATP